MNKQIEARWHIGFELPIVFIDSWSQKKPHNEDPTEQKYFINETQKLWDFAISKGDFKFRNIDEVIDENEELHKENAELKIRNEKLARENVDLRNETDSLKDQVSLLQQNIEYLEMQYNASQDTIDDMKEQIKNLNAKIDDLTLEKHDLENDLDDCKVDLNTAKVLGIYVKIDDLDASGCNDCDMELTINFEDGTSCKTGYIESGRNDWERGQEYLYLDTIIGDCNNFVATGGVSNIQVTHHGDDGVGIKEWKIVTDRGMYNCPDDWYDDGDSRSVTCTKD